MFNIACDHRRAITPPDPCVSFSAVQLSCPAGNKYFGLGVKRDHGGYPKLKCRTCGLKRLPADSSNLLGIWAGRISWGPNQFEGVVSETEIHSYKVYITDSWYQKLGQPVLYREVKMWATLRMKCCDLDFYSGEVEVLLPENSSYFMVVPVTLAGLELNVGPVSDRIVDVGTRQAKSAALRPYATPLLALLSSAVAIFFRRDNEFRNNWFF